MADGIPLHPAAGDDAPPQQQDSSLAEPPPLDSICVRAPGARGLNKPAILAAAGGGVALVLLLASGAFSGDPSTQPVATKPLMSDPARPEMAQGALRSLPADYAEAAAREAREADTAPGELTTAYPLQPGQPEPGQPEPGPPRLGPPLPGDIAAFAQAPPADMSAYGQDWSVPEAYTPPTRPDPALAEAAAADRAGIFFALRQEPRTADSASPQTRGRSSPPPLSVAMAAAPDPELRPGPQRSDRVLFPGTVIPASLVTDLNSESPGPVIAQVTQSIYDSATGRIALIPQGARLLGEYRSSSRYGQRRVAITWSRLIMPDGDEVVLDEVGADPSGAAGIKGEVDDHWWDVFGAAALGTLINVGVATTEEPQLTYSGIGAVSRDPVDAAIADGVQRSASGVTNRVVDRGLAVPPTIRVAAGSRVTVLVTRRTSL